MIRIARGKIIKLALNGADIMPQGTTLTLDSELTLNLQSQFEPLLGFAVNKSIGALSGAISAATGFGVSTGQFKELGYKIWTGTEPIQFTFSTTLNMKHSAKNDVWIPMQELMKLPLPMEAQGLDASDGLGGFGLIAPGPSIAEAAGINTKFKRNYSFRCGPFYLPKVVISRVEPSFSTESDEDGYPIWATLTVDVSSLFVATTRDIQNFGFTNASNENWTYQ